nr:MAG TPA: hypothetical protein [Bacteriophage sp.]
MTEKLLKFIAKKQILISPISRLIFLYCCKI